MRTTLILASTALAALLASGVALVAVEEPARAAFPGENGRIAYFNCDGGDCEIYSIPPGEGYLPTQLTDNWQADMDPAYSPEGTDVAFVRWDGQSANGPNYDIWVVSHHGAPEQRVTNTGTDEKHPAYSPDGNTIVYMASDGQDEEIYAIPASGGSPTRLTDNSTKDVAPVYSPDGSTIAYMAHDGQDFEIATMPAGGGAPTKLTDNTTADSYPDFSPDGATIAYGSHDGQDVEIYSVPATGGTPTKLTDNTLSDSGPAYSPDGEEIAYMSYDGQDNEITTMPAGGGTPTRVTDNATPDYFPDWGVAAEAPRDTTPPDTVIDSGPQGPTNDATPTFTFTGSDDTTARADLLYSYKVDVGEWSPHSAEASATLGGESGLSDGGHTFYVRAEDGAGIPDFSPAERSFTVDTAAPVAQPPARGLVGGSTLGATTIPVRLSWWATEVGTRVAAFQLQQSVNGGAYADVSLPSDATSALTASLDPGTTYRYQVRAQDAAGNWSAWAPGPSFVLTAVQENGTEVTYPAGSWTRTALSGSYGGYVKHASASGARARFAFTGDEVAWISTTGANRGKAEVWLDGVKVKTIDLYSATTQPRRVVFSQGGLAPTRSHTLQVRVLGTKNASSSGKRVDIDAFVALR